MSRKPLEYFLLFLVLTSGMFLRARDLGSPTLWVDEAESSVNALTILQHGYPVDHYLGLPLYENTLIRPWPENPEYEFKDLSYSDRGMAIYHGWLPLYAIAASFAYFAIEPDELPDHLQARHSREEIEWRTIAARLPSVVFGMATLLLLFVAGHTFSGRDTAWAALVAGAYFNAMVWMSRQARYYSATIAVSLACGLMLWLMLKRGRWRDFLGGGLAFVLLFHTHSLSFVILGVLFALMTPFMLSHRQAFGKIACLALLVIVGTLPWMLWTGFLEQSQFIPRAWPFLSLPADLLPYLADRKMYILLYGLGVLWLLSFRFLSRTLPARFKVISPSEHQAVAMLCAWVFLAVVAFLFLIPAASFFFTRLSLLLLPPGLLLAAIFMASLARFSCTRQSVIVAPLLFLCFLLASGRMEPVGGKRQDEVAKSDFHRVIEFLQGVKFPPTTKLYATPNNHLRFTFYTGLPFQSIAAVRKEFLDTYDGNIVLLELFCCPVGESDPLSWQGLQEATLATGQLLTEAEAKHWAALLSHRIAREEVTQYVTRVHPPLEDLPPVFAHALQQQRQLVTTRRETLAQIYEEFPMCRGYTISTSADWWQIFFYRFANPDARRGPHLNYRDRLQHADAFAIPSTPWVLFYSRPHRLDANSPRYVSTVQGVQ